MQKIWSNIRSVLQASKNIITFKSILYSNVEVTEDLAKAQLFNNNFTGVAMNLKQIFDTL